MKKSEFISLRAERIYNAISSSFEFPGKAETLDVLSHIKDPLSLLEAITKLRSNNAVIGLVCDDLRDLDQAVLHMEFDPETAPAAKKRQAVKSVELPTVANSATVETAKTETAKTETAKTETAKTETAKTEPAKAEPAKAEPAKAEPAKAEPAKAEPAKAEPAKAEPAKAEGSDPLDFDFADDPKPATEPAKTEAAAKEPESDATALKAVNVDDIRALAIKAAKAGKMAAVTAYLKAAGVPKVQDLDPSKFADFITAMHKAGV